ncbi:MAG: hypothetical protein EBV42_05045 [Actinobacteria bacterium]|nr:hypothetical protein [Actinomycetota bacterium]
MKIREHSRPGKVDRIWINERRQVRTKYPETLVAGVDFNEVTSCSGGDYDRNGYDEERRNEGNETSAKC